MSAVCRAPNALTDLLIRQEAGETIDTAELARQVETATAHVIDKQVEAGVDVGNDGEQSRVGFQTYVPRCLCGFGGESKRPPARDQLEFPSYVRQTATRFPHTARVMNAPAALSDVRYVNSAPIKEDAAQAQAHGGPVQRMFHDGAVTGHRRHDDAQSALRQPRGLSDGPGESAVQRISGHPRRRPDPADRRSRPGDGAASVFRRSD